MAVLLLTDFFLLGAAATAVFGLVVDGVVNFFFAEVLATAVLLVLAVLLAVLWAAVFVVVAVDLLLAGDDFVTAAEVERGADDVVLRATVVGACLYLGVCGVT
jgi:hypothetical protein